MLAEIAAVAVWTAAIGFFSNEIKKSRQKKREKLKEEIKTELREEVLNENNKIKMEEKFAKNGESGIED